MKDAERAANMRLNLWTIITIVGLFIGGCATIITPPSAEVRNALAPTGTLRVGILPANALQVTKDASGELKGVSIDIGKELARLLGVSFTAVSFSSPPALIAGQNSAQWDVAFLAFDPARAKSVEYVAPYMEVELGYLVLQESRIKSLSDVDAPGIRIAVGNKGGPDLFLSHNLKHAELIRGAGTATSMEMLKSGKANVVAANKPTLFVESDRLPGSRVLDGRFSVAPYSMAIAKERGVANAYLHKFIEEIKASGLIKSSIEKAGLRGVVVASPQ